MKPGDKVVMNNKYYVSAENKRRIWTVASEPWMCCGTLVVKTALPIILPASVSKKNVGGGAINAMLVL